jgi:hypothetical protein
MCSNRIHIFSLFLLYNTLLFVPLYADLTSFSKSDPNPPFSTLNIDERLLLTRQQMIYKGMDGASLKNDRFLFSVSPFAQNADKGKGIEGQPCRTTFADTIACPNIPTALGDLEGRSNMLALLYGPLPQGYDTYPGGEMGYLELARAELFPGLERNVVINDEEFIDLVNQRFAYFSFILEYRKRGVRFEVAWRVYKDFVLRLQTGVSSIRQVVENRINLTNTATDIIITDDINIESVNDNLMDQVDNIAQQINLDIRDTNHAGMEEVRINACWRHAFDINSEETAEWPRFLVIPYIQISGSFSPDGQRKTNQLFSVPFGNNGHPSTGLTAGMNFDFFESIEIGGEVGFTHFFKRDYCNYPVPNSKFQTTIFPFRTNVSIQPGNNWHFTFRIAAFHYLENLSSYFEWFVVDHKEDSICLETPDDAYLPHVLEKRSTFKTKGGNLGLNYDISPNIGLGFLWQIPFSQRNVYRSSTIMAGIAITF